MKDVAFPIRNEQICRARHRRLAAQRESEGETSGFRWDEVINPFSPFNAIDNRPYFLEWADRCRQILHPQICGLGEIAKVKPQVAEEIGEALDATRTLVENALFGLASLTRGLTPDNQGLLKQIAVTLAVPEVFVMSNVIGELVHQFGFVHIYLDQIARSRGRSLALMDEDSDVMARFRVTAGTIEINMRSWSSLGKTACVALLFHEIVHAALGGEDIFYINDLIFPHACPTLSTWHSYQDHVRYVTASIGESQSGPSTQLGPCLSRMMRQETPALAVQRFLNNRHERVELLIHNPDTIVLIAKILAGELAENREPSIE